MTDDLSPQDTPDHVSGFIPETVDIQAAEAYLSAIATVTVSYLASANARATVLGDADGTVMRRSLQHVAAQATPEECEVILHAVAALSTTTAGWSSPEAEPEPCGPVGAVPGSLVITEVRPADGGCCRGNGARCAPPAASFC